MILAELIKEAMRHEGVVVAYVYGPFGHGKTSYALWTAYYVYGSWELALEHLYFSPRDALPRMHDAVVSGERIPVLIFDDAGLWLDRMTWWEKPKVVFTKFFNIIRSVAAGVIFTCPSAELPRLLLKKVNFRIRVSPISSKEVYSLLGEEKYARLREVVVRHGLREVYGIATSYQLVTLPSFMSIVSKKWKDIYPLHYPVHSEYVEKRRRAVEYYFNELVETLGVKIDERAKIREIIIKMIEQGRTRSEIVKALMSRGIPRSTAYYYVKKFLGPARKIKGKAS